MYFFYKDHLCVKMYAEIYLNKYLTPFLSIWSLDKDAGKRVSSFYRSSKYLTLAIDYLYKSQIEKKRSINGIYRLELPNPYYRVQKRLQGLVGDESLFSPQPHFWITFSMVSLWWAIFLCSTCPDICDFHGKCFWTIFLGSNSLDICIWDQTCYVHED